MFGSFSAGNSSNGKASSAQYLLMIGATLCSMNTRTCFTTASSSAFSVPASSQKSLFGTVSGFGWAMPACTVDTSVLLHTDARCEGFLGSIIDCSAFLRHVSHFPPPCRVAAPRHGVTTSSVALGPWAIDIDWVHCFLSDHDGPVIPALS